MHSGTLAAALRTGFATLRVPGFRQRAQLTRFASITREYSANCARCAGLKPRSSVQRASLLLIWKHRCAPISKIAGWTGSRGECRTLRAGDEQRSITPVIGPLPGRSE